MATSNVKTVMGRGLRASWLAILVLLVSVAVFGWWHTHSGMTVATLDTLMLAELPNGSNRQEVELWCDRNRIQCRYSSQISNPQLGYANCDVLEHAGVNASSLSGMMTGKLGPEFVAQDLVAFSTEIDLFFFFDNDGRLAGHFFRRVPIIW
jgi:hypothetical protein